MAWNKGTASAKGLHLRDLQPWSRPRSVTTPRQGAHACIGDHRGTCREGGIPMNHQPVPNASLESTCQCSKCSNECVCETCTCVACECPTCNHKAPGVHA